MNSSKVSRTAKLATFATIISGAVVATTSAGAIPIDSLLTAGVPSLLSDNSGEYLIKGPGAGGFVVEVGDRLRGTAAINTIEPQTPGGTQTNIGGTTQYSELTALFDITVASVTPGGSCGFAFCYTFAPTPGFAAEATSLGFGPNMTGVMALFFQDPSNDYTRNCLTTDATFPYVAGSCESFATNGLPYWAFGMDSVTPANDGSDDFWWAGTRTNNIVTLGSQGLTDNEGTFNVGLTLISHPTGPNLSAFTCNNTFSGPGAPIAATVNACAGGALLGKGSEPTAFNSFDDVNFTVAVAAVPEPGSLLLLGMGLLGLAGLRRRLAR